MENRISKCKLFGDFLTSKINDFVYFIQKQNAYVRLISEQKKKKLETLEKEDDLDTALKKLIDQAKEFNMQRFHCSMEFKVELLLGQGFR